MTLNITIFQTAKTTAEPSRIMISINGNGPREVWDHDNMSDPADELRSCIDRALDAYLYPVKPTPEERVAAGLPAAEPPPAEPEAAPPTKTVPAANY